MQTARIWEEIVSIPTYAIGKAEKNPIFIDKRVYQGSSGKVYPYPMVEQISDEKIDCPYHAVFLENEYLKVMILPELGGRIQRACDKTNGYDFVYYNHVIKPALVGLTGPWISGGIEFNWPQHHRPSTFLPVDYTLQQNPDGSCTVLLNDTDRIYGTKGIAKISLYPGKAYIEIEGQLYNRTPLPQSFLWWANPAVPVNQNTQTVFPPDVHAVMDHGKRDVSRFPIATGTYYKKDYSEGVDISRYKNIPVPTSFMAASSRYDFVGGYDNGVQAGILHVADHHISPGKKQWTWGCGDFGQAWDRNLTDSDGPYVELMTGVYTDNQPDFTWLKPFEEKTFHQYFMPYKRVGMVKNATIHAAVNMERNGNGIHLCVYATSAYPHAEIVLKNGQRVIWHETAALSPVDVFEKTVAPGNLPAQDSELSVQVLSEGECLVSYRPDKPEIPQLPSPAEAAREPAEIMTNEELYLTGQHLEQYRHATYLPDPYYLEGLKRDPGDIRINNAYGMLLLRRGCFAQAEAHFRKAIERLTSRNPNPYNSEAYYDLGLSLLYQQRPVEAYDAFFKATWTQEQQEMSFYYLAALDLAAGRTEHALAMVERSLVNNAHNIKARALKAVALRKLQRSTEAAAWRKSNLTLDPFDFVSGFEDSGSDSAAHTEWIRRMGAAEGNWLRTARDYAEFGCYAEALEVLDGAPASPMVLYTQGAYQMRLGQTEQAKAAFLQAEAADPYCCFPNALEEIPVLEAAIQGNPNGSKAYYYLGNLYYDKLQWQKALALWERSRQLNDTYPTVLRNLALAYYNKCHDPAKASEAMERAFALDPLDARVFLERDQLHKRLGASFAERLADYRAHTGTFLKRDDLCTEYVTLLNAVRQPQEAYDFMLGHHFHPWEGGEGKITAQYVFSLVELALVQIRAQNWAQAQILLEKALVYPHNLGEGKLEGTKDNHIHYYLGCVKEKLGHSQQAAAEFALAAQGTDEPAGMMYYNDQPADMILYQGLALQKLGKKGPANARFYRLIDYGENHLREHIKIGYFAVSLPDFLIFEDDLDQRNATHCYFLMALGSIGLGEAQKAAGFLHEALTRDPANCRIEQYRWLLADQTLNVVR